MRLLKTKIKDFQSLNEVTIEHGNLNILWGSSDLGKSAIIRAIRSLHRNTATPDDIRFGKQKLSVEQEFEDGTIVKYEKSKSTNSYSLNDKTYNKVGREIPEAIKESLTTDKLVLDKDQELDLNFQTQFEGHFLLSDASSLVTKTISSLSGIHFIYSALREAATQSQRLKAQSQGLIVNIKSIEKFEEFKKESDLLVDKAGKLEDIQNIRNNLQKEIEVLKGYKERLDKLNKVSVDPKLSNKNLEDLLWSLGERQSIQHQLQLLEDIKDKANKVKTIDYGPKLSEIIITYNKLIGIFSNIENNKTGYNRLVDILANIKLNRIAENKITVEQETLEVEEKELKNKIKICPACNRVL